MTDTGKSIIEKVKNDPKLKEGIKNCKTKDEGVKYLNKNGLKCTIEDFEDASTNKKVSLDELKKVSGGVACVCVFYGGGYHIDSITWRCECYFTGEGEGECSCNCTVGGDGYDN